MMGLQFGTAACVWGSCIVQNREIGKGEPNAFLTAPQNTTKWRNFEYKWTMACVLVVRNTKKGPTKNCVITINVVRERERGDDDDDLLLFFQKQNLT